MVRSRRTSPNSTPSLVGPRPARRELVAEAHDLVDASEAYAAAGYDAEEAAILAVADFGRVDEVAPAFQATLAVAASRRTAWLPLGALAIQPFLWDDGINLTGSTADVDGRVYAVLDQGIEILGTLVMAGAFAALLVTGVGNRWRFAGRGSAHRTPGQPTWLYK